MNAGSHDAEREVFDEIGIPHLNMNMSAPPIPAHKKPDFFATLDGDLPYQQNLSVHELAVVALRAKTNRLADPAESH